VAQVKIVTDSNAFLPTPGLAAELGVEIVPLVIRISPTGRSKKPAQIYHEGINLSNEAFLRRLAQDSKAMSVEAPSIEQVKALFERLGQTTDKIVCIHVSSALNDIAEVMGEAAKSFVGRQRIIILDTATTSVGLGLIVEAAARVAATGVPPTEVVRVVRGMIPHMYALFFSDSLEYLEVWGRLGPAQTLLGTMLGLKPLSTMEDGDLLPVEKVRHYERAVDKLYEFIIEFSHIEHLYIVQHGFENEAALLLDRLELTYPGRAFPIIGYPPSLAVHIGPKALGVIVHESDR
jgi:DegV family protein with EDD domain